MKNKRVPKMQEGAELNLLLLLNLEVKITSVAEEWTKNSGQSLLMFSWKRQFSISK